MRIGIDIGGVIIAQDIDEPDLFFTDNFLRAKSFPNCFETIKQFVTSYGKENVFIISKCGIVVQKKSMEWLESQSFFSVTGFDRENIHFCFARHEKASIANHLDLNVFIDDRYTVLKYMLTSEQPERLILFCPTKPEQDLNTAHPNNKIQQVESWEEIERLLKV